MAEIRERSTLYSNFDEPVSITDSTTGITVSGLAGVRKFKKIADTDTPNFTALLKCGEFLPLNPVTILTETEVKKDLQKADLYNPLIPSKTYKGSVGAASVFSAPPPPWPPIIPEDSLVDAAVIAARANVNQEKWDVLTFMAELSSTVETMGVLAGSFWNSTHKIAVLARKAKKNPWKEFRELWLLGRYGVRPIAYDFADATRTARKLVEQVESVLITGKGFQKTETTPSVVISGPSNHKGWTNATRTVTTGQLTRIYRSAAYAEMSAKWNSSFQADPLVTAWELVPYSFVLDWFVNVGAWISTLSPLLRGEYLGTSASVKYTTTSSVLVTWAPRPNIAGIGGSAIWTRELEQYTRWPYTGLPLPGFDLKMSALKLVDLFALCVKGRNETYKIMRRR